MWIALISFLARKCLSRESVDKLSPAYCRLERGYQPRRIFKTLCRWNLILRFVLLPEQGNKNYSFKQIGMEATTVAFNVNQYITGGYKKHILIVTVASRGQG